MVIAMQKLVILAGLLCLAAGCGHAKEDTGKSPDMVSTTLDASDVSSVADTTPDIERNGKPDALSVKDLGAPPDLASPGPDSSDTSGVVSEKLTLVFSASINGGPCNRSDGNGCDLYMAALDLSTMTVSDLKALATESNVGEVFPTLSPDGRYVVYDRKLPSGASALYWVATENGTPALLIDGRRFPHFSPDGLRLAFSDSGKNANLYLGSVHYPSAEGQPLLLDSVNGLIPDGARQEGTLDPEFFPDGKQLSFHFKTKTEAQTGVLTLDSGQVVTLTDAIGCGHSAVSPSGNKVSCELHGALGFQVMERQGQGFTAPKNLFKPLTPSMMEAIDSRYADCGMVAHSYIKWCGQEDLVLFAAQCWKQDVAVFSRLFMARLKGSDETPQLYDISKQIDALGGVSNVDINSATCRLQP